MPSRSLCGKRPAWLHELVRRVNFMKMTPEQEKTYANLREAGFEFSHVEYTGDVFMNRTDRSCDSCRRLSTWVIPKDGKAYQMPELFRSA